MLITRTSELTGIKRTREINVEPEQLQQWKAGELIQVAMPQLSKDDREFIKTGIIKNEWDEAFREEMD